MSRWRIGGFGKGARLRPAFLRPELLPFLIAVALAGHWFGAPAMILLSLTVMSVAWMTSPARTAAGQGTAPGTRPHRPEAEAVLDQFLQDGGRSGLRTACLVVGPDDANALLLRLGHDDFEALIRRIGARLHGTLRDADRVVRIDRARFAILLSPTPHPDIENMIQLAVRLQTSCEVALPVAGQSLAVSIHLGICLSERAPARNGTAMLMAAEDAALEAEAHGPGAIRMFSATPPPEAQRREELAAEIPAALDAGQILACFQPQISMDTGVVSGLEVMPHWKHPRHGLLGPAEILAALPPGDLVWKLMDGILRQALESLRIWERDGFGTGLLSVVFPPAVLTHPKLTDRLQWALEGFDLEPARLCLVLQGDAVSHPDEGMVLRNLTRCAEIGCVIELSGLGGGPIPVEMMRRAAVRRLRLPRSLVSRIDRETEQQKIVAAFAAMADGLRMETLAEGVASQSESAMLAQLGCRHLQGDAIAAPMPFAETRDWIERHNAKLNATPRIPTRRGG
ncbi:GGDEF domain-containing protein [Sinirhodobacter populi]|uniref:GGDEF domain-containing protein n=1 Tax=Paenirhodobacter populi TaxID=2306993 RepID=A0A443KLX1_9RHOB|nr:GGDEF domain-containing protein [Sinirhodobacter populi]RWR33710.1 GGDEF domain-containing protein [Sinirhodobacter populi]